MEKRGQNKKFLVVLWLAVSLLWAASAFPQTSQCTNFGKLDSWLGNYPTLKNWYHFYVAQLDCDSNEKGFIELLSDSEALSIQLAEAKVTFEQCYVPMSEMIDSDFDRLETDRAGEIQGNLMQIEQCLHKAMRNMSPAEQDYFRALVLLRRESQFV